MEAARRRRMIQLGVLSLGLIWAIWYFVLPALAPAPVARGPVAASGPTGTAKNPGRPVDVKLDALGRSGAETADGVERAQRNPFRMGAATAPVPEGTLARGPVKPVVSIPPPAIGPPPTPPVPPIPYRFIGVLSGVPGQGRIAVLTDGRTVVHGRVNEVIEGRYRIVQIGEESVQLEHADGRGRQTIRLLAR